MVMRPNENFSIRISTSVPIIRLAADHDDRVTVQVRRVVFDREPWQTDAEEQTAEIGILTLAHADAVAGVVGGRGPAQWPQRKSLADHLSTSQTIMISTSTTKTIVQTCQLAVGRRERRSLSGMP
jgi:hypothetical protein